MAKYQSPGILLPTAYSSEEEFAAELQRRCKEAGFTPLSDDVLEHFGVKGMHWGVRTRTQSAYGEAKAKQHELAVASRPARVTARKVTEVVGDPRSAATFAATVGIGALLIKSPGARHAMKASVVGVAKVANTKRGRKVTVKVLKGAGHVYMNR